MKRPSPDARAPSCATHQIEMEQAVAALRRNAAGWLALDLGERIRLADELLRGMYGVAPRWIEASLGAKGARPGTFAEAEEWLLLTVVLRALRQIRRSLEDVRDTGRPRVPGPIRQRPDGQVVVRVFPRSRVEGLMYWNMTGDAWLEPDVTLEEVRSRDGWCRRGRPDDERGEVALVLGAGNVSMLPVIDVLHQLFVEGRTVVLKPSPVNAYLGPLIEEGLGALVERGWLRVVFGGAPEGEHLCRHPEVDAVHLTGSSATFEAVVFGGGEEGAARRAERRPRLSKPLLSELSNVSPVIVVPGPWTDREVEEQAVQIATWLVGNAGFGCLTPRVLIQHRQWPRREALLDALGRVLERVETRPAYYPGAAQRHADFLAAHPGALRFGRPQDDHLPWTVIPDVDAARPDDVCFRRDPFCGLLAETALSAATTADFLEQAVDFANTTLWGSLNATLLVHPASFADPSVAAAVERAVASLRYGTVLVNAAAFLGYYFQTTPWGAFPGHPPWDIQSGAGKTGNWLLLPRPQKSVVRGPFSKRPDPLTVASSGSDGFARRLTAYEASPSLIGLLGVTWAALRAHRSA